MEVFEKKSRLNAEMLRRLFCFPCKLHNTKIIVKTEIYDRNLRRI